MIMRSLGRLGANLIAAYYNVLKMDLDLREVVLREVGTAIAALTGCREGGQPGTSASFARP